MEGGNHDTFKGNSEILFMAALRKRGGRPGLSDDIASALSVSIRQDAGRHGFTDAGAGHPGNLP